MQVAAMRSTRLLVLKLLYCSLCFRVGWTFVVYPLVSTNRLHCPETPLASTNRLADDTTRNTAIEALKELRDRQRADLEETERLLETVVEGTDPTEIHANIATSLLTATDYGFLSRSEGAQIGLPGNWDSLKYSGPPPNICKLSTNQFWRNWKAIQGEYSDEPDTPLTKRQQQLQSQLQLLTLNSTQIWEKETEDGPIEAPLIIKVPYLAVCWMLDVLFEDRSVPARFFLLETVARMPYFSYISMLHLYETLGFWRRSEDVKRIHFAQELNEYRHLTIMESIGGDQVWWVRFVAQHSAIVYYFVLCLLYAISPSLSYRFSELLETHAVHTYSTFLENNEQLLKELPPSRAAVDYYTLGIADPLYKEFQTSALVTDEEFRRPGIAMTSLYDVFEAICNDEGDHVFTMSSCLDTDATLQSTSLELRALTSLALVAVASSFGGLVGFDDAPVEEVTGVDLLEGSVIGLAIDQVRQFFMNLVTRVLPFL